jgi:CRISPR system Cascade subunit CasB
MTTATPPQRRSHPALDWWKSVCDPQSGDPAARARLRRCRSTADVISIPAGVRLPRMLGVLPRVGKDLDARFARGLDLARVLAHVSANSAAHPMRGVGWPAFPGSRREGDTEKRPKMSEARFRRLLQSEPGEDLVSQFTRLVALLGGETDIAALSDGFRYWDDEDGRTKQRWSFEYFDAGSAMRSGTTPPEDASV